jgi:hypothetical protein
MPTLTILYVLFTTTTAARHCNISNTAQDSYMLGLMNTVYTVGGIITGWFFAGPLVGSLLLGLVKRSS